MAAARGKGWDLGKGHGVAAGTGKGWDSGKGHGGTPAGN